MFFHHVSIEHLVSIISCMIFFYMFFTNSFSFLLLTNPTFHLLCNQPPTFNIFAVFLQFYKLEDVNFGIFAEVFNLFSLIFHYSGHHLFRLVFLSFFFILSSCCQNGSCIVSCMLPFLQLHL